MLRRAALLCIFTVGLWAPGVAWGVPWYLWQFAEWREHELSGGLKLVPEPFNDRKGGYVIDIWDLLGPTIFGYEATLSVAGYNEGNTFFANARSPLHGGVSGNTVGGDAFIQVRKRYHKDSDISALRFTYSKALLEVTDYGSAAPPWKAPYAQIIMEVDVFQDGVGYVWGLTQTALARSDAGIDLTDLADDIWVLDITGETRGLRRPIACSRSARTPGGGRSRRPRARQTPTACWRTRSPWSGPPSATPLRRSWPSTLRPTRPPKAPAPSRCTSFARGAAAAPSRRPSRRCAGSRVRRPGSTTSDHPRP